MTRDRYPPRTNDATVLYNAGQQYLDIIETLGDQLADHLAADIGMGSDRFTDIDDAIPDRLRLGAADDYEEPMDEWVLDPADWRQQVRDTDGTVDEAIIYTWPDATDDSSTVGVATTVVDLLLETTESEVTLEGLWTPTKGVYDSEYNIIITSSVSTTDAGSYDFLCSVSTDGTVSVRLELTAYGQRATHQPLVDHTYCDSDDETDDTLSEAVDSGRRENWARVVMGSYAAELASTTALSNMEALVYLLSELPDVETDEDIAAFLNRSRSSIATQRQQAREKFSNADDEIRKYKRTKTIGEMDCTEDILVQVDIIEENA